MIDSLLIFTIAILSCSSSLGFVFKAGILRLRKSIYSSRNVPNNKFESTLHSCNGLLSGVSNIASANYYSSNLILTEASALVKNNRLLYDIVEKECESDPVKIVQCLESIENKMDKFMDKNEVWDRMDLKNELNDVARKKGKFVCLLGGKSTGKSLVLEDFSLQKNDPRKVIYVDMRSDYSSITYGFLSVINKSKNTQLIDIAWGFLKKSLASKVKLSDQIEVDFHAFLDFIKTEQRPTAILEDLLAEMIEKLSPEEVITLVVDEANDPFTISDKTSDADIKELRASLNLFTKLTKQNKKINVILVSSEHVFPFRLADTRLGFNLKDITEFLFAGEVPPKEMFKLLTQEWELSENLSLALISLYGGHIWDIYQALMRLRKMKEDFYSFDANLSANIDMCFEGEKVDKEETKNYLKQLAESGFVPLKKRNDPIAEVISKNNVGGVVAKSALNVGLPKNVWNGDLKFGLVPSSQSTRLLIAEYLVINGMLTDNK